LIFFSRILWSLVRIYWRRLCDYISQDGHWKKYTSISLDLCERFEGGISIIYSRELKLKKIPVHPEVNLTRMTVQTHMNRKFIFLS
jgi:hypothetical protein